MTLEKFFEKFELFADAPNAVAKMQELILHMAVRGKLAPQDPGDEPAVHLLQRITKQRRFLKAREYSSVEPDETPYDIPNLWLWVRLGSISLTSESGWSPQCDPEPRTGDNWGVLKVSAVSWGAFRPDENKALPSGIKERSECEVHAGDFLLSRANTEELVARSVVVEETPPRLMMSDKIVRFTFPDEIEKAFVNLANASAFARDYYAKNASGTSSSMKNVSREVMCNLPIPLPPLAEQKRIVAKVDELMALCDRLEAQQKERETQQAALARAAVTRFADAPTPANIELLFHKSYSVSPADLRKMILTLAVQGKLVPQDPNDEPAECILAATRALFERLIEERGLTTPKPLPPINDNETAFKLPEGWVWCRLGQILRISSGDGLTSKSMNDGSVLVYGGNGVTGHHDAYNVSKPTLVIGRVGYYCGSVHVTPEKAWVTDNAFISTFDESNVDIRFLTWLLKATDLRERDNATAQPVISGTKIYPIVLGIPPLAEQRRIVAKVDQLVSLVDKLEAQLAASRAAAALMDALVAELTEAKEDVASR